MTGDKPISARRSIFTRLVWWAIGLSGAVVLALWWLTHSTIGSMADEAASKAVDVDLAGLVDIYASGGMDELTQRIDDRLALTLRSGNAPHYLLARNDGTRLAGDLREWPPLDARLSQAGRVTIDDDVQVYARATQIGPDLKMVVAREFGDTAALQRRVQVVFLLTGIALVVAVGLLGRFAARRLSARITRINAAFRDPKPETLDSLVVAQDGDEIDELTGRSASVISRVTQLMEAHRETSDHIAHEIRTPLMHIDSKIVKALRQKDNPEKSDGFLVAARQDIRRLVGMLESLLDIASSKARQGDRAGLRPIDLSDLVKRVCELYADSAEESGHMFDYRIAPDIEFEGEDMQLTRLVTNLLDNAFKYVPAGGAVTLTLEDGPQLIVEDNGPGIDPKHIDHVFERFHRGTGSNISNTGAGLGLALAKAIADRHGLSIHVKDNRPGARFVVERGDEIHA